MGDTSPAAGGTKTAVVTGAAGAIGQAVCRRLLTRGYDVIAVDRDAGGLATLPDQVVKVTADLTEDGFPDIVAQAVDAHANGLHLLVHNAGVVLPGSVADRAPDDTRREQAINLQAPILLTERLFQHLRITNGAIVAVGSGGALFPMAASPGYSASKAGLRAYLLALSASPDTAAMRIALVHPTAVDTPMLRYEAEHGGSPANFLSEPMSPAVVADAVVGALDHARLETFLPRSSSVYLKALNVFPALVRRIEPLLSKLGQRGLRRYLARPAGVSGQ